MIDTRELMKGNLLLDDEGKIIRISGFAPIEFLDHGIIFDIYEQSEPNTFSDAWGCNISKIKPIPLTEAVLMAAGCDKKTCGYGTPYLWNEYLFKNEGHMNFDKQGGGWVFKRSLYGNTIIIAEVSYLHQLQNLIFCLTNEELEINMEELKKAVG